MPASAIGAELATEAEDVEELDTLDKLEVEEALVFIGGLFGLLLPPPPPPQALKPVIKAARTKNLSLVFSIIKHPFVCNFCMAEITAMLPSFTAMLRLMT